MLPTFPRPTLCHAPIASVAPGSTKWTKLVPSALTGVLEEWETQLFWSFRQVSGWIKYNKIMCQLDSCNSSIHWQWDDFDVLGLDHRGLRKDLSFMHFHATPKRALNFPRLNDCPWSSHHQLFHVTSRQDMVASSRDGWNRGFFHQSCLATLLSRVPVRETTRPQAIPDHLTRQDLCAWRTLRDM